MIKIPQFGFVSFLAFFFSMSIFVGMNALVKESHCDAITLSFTHTMIEGDLDPSSAQEDLAYFRQNELGWPYQYWAERGVYLSEKLRWKPIYFSQHHEYFSKYHFVINLLICFLLSICTAAGVELLRRVPKVVSAKVDREQRAE